MPSTRSNRQGQNLVHQAIDQAKPVKRKGKADEKTKDAVTKRGRKVVESTLPQPTSPTTYAEVVKTGSPKQAQEPRGIRSKRINKKQAEDKQTEQEAAETLLSLSTVCLTTEGSEVSSSTASGAPKQAEEKQVDVADVDKQTAVGEVDKQTAVGEVDKQTAVVEVDKQMDVVEEDKQVDVVEADVHNSLQICKCSHHYIRSICPFKTNSISLESSKRKNIKL